MPVKIDIKTEHEEVSELLEAIARRMGDTRPAMELIGETVVAAIAENFEQQGRPEKWAPLSEVTKKRRQAAGKSGKILQVSGTLKKIIYQASKHRLEVMPTPTAQIYAATQQFGAKKGAFGKTRKGAPIPWGDIPARPFMVIPKETWGDITDTLTDYILAARKI